MKTTFTPETIATTPIERLDAAFNGPAYTGPSGDHPEGVLGQVTEVFAQSPYEAGALYREFRDSMSENLSVFTEKQKKAFAIGMVALVGLVPALDATYKGFADVVRQMPEAKRTYSEAEIAKMPTKTIVRDEPGMYANAIARESNPVLFDGKHKEEAHELVESIMPMLERDNPRTVEVPVFPEQQEADKIQKSS